LIFDYDAIIMYTELYCNAKTIRWRKESDMDINSILNGVSCNCGRPHNCDIECVLIEKGALTKLNEICGQEENLLLVADENTFSAAGCEVEKQLSGKNIKKVIFSGKTVLIPNEEAIESVRAELDGVQMIVAVGSGVIQDLCKCVAFFAKIPYIVVATAPSMDGYASNGAAMILGGMKETVAAGLPRAIIADTDVLKNAPMEMIKAGYGDIIGKYSALCDWRLSKIVNDEYFCQYIYDITYKMIEETLETAAGLKERDENSIKVLMEALVVVGIMMSFAGSSRPASGSEHHLSHFFEIVGIVDSEPYFPHGIDVAYSTVVTAKVREKILNSTFPDSIYRIGREEYCQKMDRIYSDVADGCIALQDRVGNYTANRFPVYKEKESEIREILREMPSSAEIERVLSLVGLDMSEFYNMYNEEKIHNAVAYAKDLKDRYSVLWLHYDLFGESI